MILRPLITMHIKPNITPWISQSRTLRPTIKIGKERFQVCIDVHQFKRDEIRVKALPEYVLVEGKQERKTKQGYILRQFVRKFKLPDGCNPKTMKTELSAEGILTITAPRKLYDSNNPCETVVPITEVGPRNKEGTLLQVEEPKSKDPCEAYKPKADTTSDKTPPSNKMAG